MIDSAEKEARKQVRLGKKYIYPWIGVDLDGTIAEYTTFISPTHIGKPIQPMCDRVKTWIEEGLQVKIFTARVSEQDPTVRLEVINAINAWCQDVFGKALPITCVKDYGMVQLFDDRAIQVEKNTGRIIGER